MSDLEPKHRYARIFVDLMRAHTDHVYWGAAAKHHAIFSENVVNESCTAERLVMSWDHHENSDYWEKQILMSHPKFIDKTTDLLSSYYTFDITGVN